MKEDTEKRVYKIEKRVSVIEHVTGEYECGCVRVSE